MAANTQPQGNALPIMPPQYTRNTPAGLSQLRTNLPTRLSFGYMLDSHGMDEDLSPSLVSPPGPDTPTTAPAGQTRQLPANGHNVANVTLPLRNPHFGSGAWNPQPVPIPPYARRPQRTASLGSASDVSESSSISSTLSEMDAKPEPAKTVKRKVIDDNENSDCAICWEPFEQHDLLWCKLTCGTNFHKNCLVDWLKAEKHARASPDFKCPFCRGPWEPAELRTLQIENGLIPPRPYKRARPDVPSTSAARAQMRRFYRERRDREHARRTGDYHLMMRGGDSYRPVYPPRMAPYPPAPNPPATSMNNLPSSSSSVQSPPGSPPMMPQPSSMSPSAPPFHPGYPAVRPGLPTGSGDYYRPPAPFGMSQTYHSPYSMQPQMPMMSTMTNAVPQSHDLTAPGFNAPPFAPNPFLPSMAMTPQHRIGENMPPQQRAMTRCPALQQRNRMPSSPPAPLQGPFNGMAGMMMPSGMGMTQVCPAMGINGMVSSGIDVQVNHFTQWSAHYHFAGPNGMN